MAENVTAQGGDGQGAGLSGTGCVTSVCDTDTCGVVWEAQPVQYQKETQMPVNQLFNIRPWHRCCNMCRISKRRRYRSHRGRSYSSVCGLSELFIN